MLKTPQEVEKEATNPFSEMDTIIDNFFLETEKFIDKLKAQIK